MRHNHVYSTASATNSYRRSAGTLRNSRDHWGKIARFLHWATALLILITFPVGWLANSLERGPTERVLFDLHFSLGTVIFVVVVTRLAWRLVDPPPGEVAGVGRLLTGAAKMTHLLIYVTLMAVFVSGYVIQVHMQPSLHLFGLIHIPRPFEPGEDESLRAFAWYVHNYGVWGLVGLVTLHAGAALWHYFVLRDQVLSRMMARIGDASQSSGGAVNLREDHRGAV